MCGLLLRVFFLYSTSEISVESPVLLALGFSFYVWNFSCPFIPFLDKVVYQTRLVVYVYYSWVGSSGI